jgi:hypothetical protein
MIGIVHDIEAQFGPRLNRDQDEPRLARDIFVGADWDLPEGTRLNLSRDGAGSNVVMLFNEKLRQLDERTGIDLRNKRAPAIKF